MLKFDPDYTKDINDIAADKVTNPLYSLGLIQNGEYAQYGDISAIRLYQSSQPSKLSTGRFPEIKGEPTVENNSSRGKTTVSQNLLGDNMLSFSTFWMPEIKMTEHEARSLNQEILVQSVRNYWSNLEFEVMITAMAGLRGCVNYDVFEEVQSDIEDTGKASTLSKIENLPDVWKKIHASNPISKPTRLLNGWTNPQKTPSDFNYNNVFVAWQPRNIFEWLIVFERWLNSLNPTLSGGRGLSPAGLCSFNEYSETCGMFNSQKRYFVMLVSPELVGTIRNCDGYNDYCCDLYSDLGEQARESPLICKIGNLLVAECDRTPRFRAGDNMFCRALVFGANTMVSGYELQHSDSHYVSSSNDNQFNSSTIKFFWTREDKDFTSQAHFGSRILRLSGGGDEQLMMTNNDSGRVAVDFLDR